MSEIAIGLICLGVLLILIYLGMRVGFAMAAVGFVGIALISGFRSALNILKLAPFRAINSSSFAAMAMFMLVGEIIYQAGFGVDMFESLKKIVGRIKGGLAIATTYASAVLGFITSSSIATITMGKVAVPEMKKTGYDETMATSAVAGGASMASIVPPSSGFLIYAMMTSESLSKLYIAAIVPALILLVLYTIGIIIKCIRHPENAPVGQRYSMREKIVSLKLIWPIALVIIISLVGIYRGFMTPTESACITAFVCAVLGLVSRRLTLKSLKNIIIGQSKTVGMVALLLSSATIFSKMITVSGISTAAADFIMAMNISPLLIMILITLLYVFLGMFTDIVSCLMITLPIFYPIVTGMGYNGLWFGVLCVSLIELGMITPPFGMNVFTLSGVCGTPATKIFKGCYTYIIGIIILIILMFVFPQICSVLVSTM